MANYNKVILIGRLTRDVELKHVPSGMAVASFGLAVNDRWRDRQSGEWREYANFIDCEAWGRLGEVIAEHMAKGRQILIDGRLKYDAWDAPDGSKRSKLKVVVDTFEFIDSRSGGGGYSGGGGGAQPAYSDSPSPATHQPISEDDIPF